MHNVDETKPSYLRGPQSSQMQRCLAPAELRHGALGAVVECRQSGGVVPSEQQCGAGRAVLFWQQSSALQAAELCFSGGGAAFYGG